jgi:heat shock protein HslJ
MSLLSPRLMALAATALMLTQLPADAQREPRQTPRGAMQEEANRPPAEQQREKQFPLGSSWTASSLNGRPFGGERPSMTLDDQLRAKGFAGCNTYSATAFPLRQQGFAVGPVAVTRRACDAASMATERAFLVALRTAQRWDLVGGQLVLRGQNAEIRFDRAL